MAGEANGEGAILTMLNHPMDAPHRRYRIRIEWLGMKDVGRHALQANLTLLRWTQRTARGELHLGPSTGGWQSTCNDNALANIV
jgi:hypothetical protein